MLVNANSSRERPVLLNRPSKNEMSSSASSKNRRMLKSRRRIEEEKKEVLKKHSQQLRTQIHTNDEKSKQDRLDYLEEGRKIRQKIDDERRKIEAIK